MFGNLQELPKCDRDRKGANAAGNMAPTDFIKAGWPQTFVL